MPEYFFQRKEQGRVYCPLQLCLFFENKQERIKFDQSIVLEVRDM